MTATITRSLVSDAAVAAVLTLADQPLSTQDIASRLAEDAGVDVAEIPMTRLRRSLERLERDNTIIGSGGPKRAELMGWPVVDGRDVQWATITVAERIRDEHRSNVERVVADQNERGLLLRELHRVSSRQQREALGLVGIGPKLTANIGYRGEHGASTWTLEELRAVWDLIEEARADHG